MTTDVAMPPCPKKLAGVGAACGSTVAKRHVHGHAWCAGCGRKVELEEV